MKNSLCFEYFSDIIVIIIIVKSWVVLKKYVKYVKKKEASCAQNVEAAYIALNNINSSIGKFTNISARYIY